MSPAAAAGDLRHWRVAAQDGLRLAVQDYGDPRAPATPLLCLTGLARNKQDFDAFARRQAARRRVVAFDYRGRGESERAARIADYAPEMLLGDSLQVMTALNLHRVVAVGTSLGGSLAMAIAVAAPTRLAGAVLNDIGPAVDTRGTARILEVIGRDHPQADWAGAMQASQQLLSNLGVPEDDADTWRRIAEATFTQGRDGRLHVAWDPRIVEPFRHGTKRDLWPLFRALRGLPVLALRGARSDILSAETLAAMRATKPDLRAVEVPGRGHAPLLDEPEAEQAIDEFLVRIDD